MNWETESEEDFLFFHRIFRGIHRQYWEHWDSIDTIDASFISFGKKPTDNFSFDWSKYTTPCFTLNKLTSLEDDKDAFVSKRNIYGILALKIGKLKKIIKKNRFDIIIQHNPIKAITSENQYLNRGHTLIIGIKKQNITKIREKICESAKWVRGFEPINN
jgi:hypothetical protein